MLCRNRSTQVYVCWLALVADTKGDFFIKLLQKKDIYLSTSFHLQLNKTQRVDTWLLEGYLCGFVQCHWTKSVRWRGGGDTTRDLAMAMDKKFDTMDKIECNWGVGWTSSTNFHPVLDCASDDDVATSSMLNARDNKLSL